MRSASPWLGSTWTFPKELSGFSLSLPKFGPEEPCDNPLKSQDPDQELYKPDLIPHLLQEPEDPEQRVGCASHI